MLKFKNIFKNVTHYSMPESILFVFSKRINFVISFLILALVATFSFI